MPAHRHPEPLSLTHRCRFLRRLLGFRLPACSWGGRGRAGTVGACLLAQLYGMSAEEALTRVQRAFDTRQDGEWGCGRGRGLLASQPACLAGRGMSN